MSMMRVTGLAALASLGLFACADEDRFDPAGTAEQGIHDQIYTELELESTVTCADPVDVAIGTEFACDALAEDGKQYRFVAVIMADEVIGTRLD